MATGKAVFKVTHPSAPRKEIDPVIGDISTRIAQDARQRSPVDTGRLAAGWQVRKNEGEYGYRLVFNDVEYAPYVEFGTPGHPAQPMIGPATAPWRGHR
jgi:hypothetical protein